MSPDTLLCYRALCRDGVNVPSCLRQIPNIHAEGLLEEIEIPLARIRWEWGAHTGK